MEAAVLLERNSKDTIPVFPTLSNLAIFPKFPNIGTFKNDHQSKPNNNVIKDDSKKLLQLFSDLNKTLQASMTVNNTSIALTKDYARGGIGACSNPADMAALLMASFASDSASNLLDSTAVNNHNLPSFPFNISSANANNEQLPKFVSPKTAISSTINISNITNLSDLPPMESPPIIEHMQAKMGKIPEFRSHSNALSMTNSLTSCSRAENVGSGVHSSANDLTVDEIIKYLLTTTKLAVDKSQLNSNVLPFGGCKPWLDGKMSMPVVNGELPVSTSAVVPGLMSNANELSALLFSNNINNAQLLSSLLDVDSLMVNVDGSAVGNGVNHTDSFPTLPDIYSDNASK